MINRDRSSQRILSIIGALWLILAATIIVTQLSSATPIKIDWETETEINTAGFNVYRSETADSDYERINPELILSKGNATSGAEYNFTDTDVIAGQTYFYQLEDVELDNTAERHPVIEYTAPLVEWWVPVVAALSIICGLFLLITGLRPEKTDNV